MSINKIISGGQTGVDRAALDVAIERGMPCGGWCPRGRLAADGPIDVRYPLTETPGRAYSQRTEWNVRDSDGTLILTVGKPRGGTALTKTLADKLGKPCLVVELGENACVDTVLEWINTHSIGVLNVAGPRDGNEHTIYNQGAEFLRKLLTQVGRSKAFSKGRASERRLAK